jgi:hypothetical protein
MKIKEITDQQYLELEMKVDLLVMLIKLCLMRKS